MLRHRERVEKNPADAKTLDIETGTLVTVTSRRGQVEAQAFVVDTFFIVYYIENDSVFNCSTQIPLLKLQNRPWKDGHVHFS